jgi:hypothetical protein
VNTKELIKEAERIQRETDKAEGAYAEVLRQLKEVFGCASLDKAEELLTEMTRELAEKEVQLERRTKRLRKAIASTKKAD